LGDLSTLDSVVLAVLAIAVVRGLFIGLIREGFSIAALGGALIAVRYGTPPLAGAIERASGGDLGATVASWIAGAAIALATLALLGALGRLLRRGAHAVGLGWADRLAGGVAGAAEGALVAAVIVVVAIWAVGTASPLTEGSKSIEVLEGLQTYLAENRDQLPEVAAPPDWLPRRE
jgi:membrane protein required for colicin V production